MPGRFLQSVWSDARYALRGFRKSPLFALTAILTLALAIGGNTAIFSMIRAVLLRPLPWPEPDRLVIVWESNQKQGTARSFPSTANFFDWRERSRSFEALAHWRLGYFNLSGDGATPERVQGARVAAAFFPILGAQPALGRGFLPGEEEPGKDRVVILSDGFWRRHFGGDRTLPGRQIVIDGEPVTVVGILPPEFRMWQVMNHDLEIYLPLALSRGQLSRSDHSLNVYGRLRRGVSLDAAEAELNPVAAQLEQEFPATNRDGRVQMVTLPEAGVNNSRPILLILAVAVGIVLVIACVNMANLMLARTRSRTREFAVRLAIGCGRGRAIRQLLTESLMLSAAGGAGGLLLAWWLVPLLDSRIRYLGLTRIHEFRIDSQVLGFGALVSILTGLLFGLSPALRCANVDLASLKTGVTGAPGRGRLIIFAEVGLTTVLLLAGGSVLEGALRLVRMDRGLDVRRVLTMQIWLPEAKYGGPPQLAGFFDRLIPQIRALPGVELAAVVNYPPLGLLETSVPVAGQNRTDEPPVARYWVVSPEYFRTVGLPLRRGRLFNDQDTDRSSGAAVISERLAQRLFPAEDPIGKQLRPLLPANSNAYWNPRGRDLPLTVIGVVPDIREDGLLPQAQPQIYLLYRQGPTRVAHLVVRSVLDPASLARAVRNEVAGLDPAQPISDIRSLASVTEEAFSRQEVVAASLGVFAGMALLLAALGIYGVVAASVGGRTREMGIRAALGAGRGALVRLVVGESLRPVLAGIGAGVAASVGASRVLASWLAGIRTWNLFTAGMICVGLAGVAAAAAYVPARRASRVDPELALRCE